MTENEIAGQWSAMTAPSKRSDGDCFELVRAGEVVARVQLPLENLHYVLASYLDENADWLDPRTRELLVSVREGLDQIALSTRFLSCPPTGRSDRSSVPGTASVER